MTHPTRWSVVLFDLDGTLANTIEAIVASYTHTWKSVGREVSREEVLTWIGRTLADVFTEQGGELAGELEQRYIAHNLACMSRLVKEYPGMPALLHDMDVAGIRTGIVTAKRHANAVLSMGYANLPETTPIVCAMEDTPKHKPDPEPLLLGLARLDARPEQALYIGDAVFDLRAAAAAGMSGIGVTWGAGHPEHLRAEPHTAVVDTVDERSEERR